MSSSYGQRIGQDQKATLKSRIESEFVELIEANVVRNYGEYVAKVKQEFDR